MTLLYLYTGYCSAYKVYNVYRVARSFSPDTVPPVWSVPTAKHISVYTWFSRLLLLFLRSDGSKILFLYWSARPDLRL